MAVSDWIELLLSGIIATLVSAAVSFVSIRFNYHELFARTVSENRMDWINKFRDEISTIVATIKVNNTDDKMLFAAEKAKASLITRLNQDITKPGNEYNKRMLEELNKVNFDLGESSNDLKKNSSDLGGCNGKIEALLDLSRKILEPEWKRVKEEARGIKNR